MKVLLVSICAFAVGAGMLCFGTRDFVMSRQAGAWPTTEGTIRSSECAHYVVVSECSTYLTHVHYSYAVAGKSFEGYRIAFGYTGSAWRWPNQKIADRLSSGRTVLVRYDPDKPSTAVLSCGLNGSTLMTLFGGSWILLVTAMIGFDARRPRSDTGVIAVALVRHRFRIIANGVGRIVLIAVIGLVLAWIGGLLTDYGILSTLVTT